MARVASPNSGSPNHSGEQRSNADVDDQLPSTLLNQTLDVTTASIITPPAETRTGQPPTGQPLPAAYRGKSSGEFQRVTTHMAPDANQLIGEAERTLARLPTTDRNRRLLEVAILRRDTALLNGILESLRRNDV